MSEVTPTRVKCPKCGSVDVKQVEDKSRVLSYVGGQPIYKKIWKCKSSCVRETYWRDAIYPS